MLPDLSAAHIFLLVVVALVVVGPKDLPALLRKIGQFMAKLRGMANEFRASFDEMARQSELDELRREVDAMRAAAAKPAADLRSAASELHGQLMQPLDVPMESVSGDAPSVAAAEPRITPPQASPSQGEPAPAKPRPKPKTTAKPKAAPAKPAARAKAASGKAPAKKAKSKAAATEPGA